MAKKETGPKKPIGGAKLKKSRWSGTSKAASRSLEEGVGGDKLDRTMTRAIATSKKDPSRLGDTVRRKGEKGKPTSPSSQRQPVLPPYKRASNEKRKTG